MHRAALDLWLSALDDALDDAREAGRPIGHIVDETRAQLASEVSAENPADARWFALELGDLARRTAPEGSRWHEVLGLQPDARPAEIEAAYRRRRSETHPDRGGQPGEFDQVQRAYEQATRGEPA